MAADQRRMFAKKFSARLSDIQDNSADIIRKLTNIGDLYKNFAGVIVDCVFRRLQEVCARVCNSFSKFSEDKIKEKNIYTYTYARNTH